MQTTEAQTVERPNITTRPARLEDRIREACRVRHYALATVRKTLWEPLLKRAGVRHRNPYQVRHTYASAQLTAGANPWWVAQQLGHVDVEMVFRTYGKFIPADYAKPKATRLRAVGGSDE